jgi:hypothetical protein
MRVTAISEISKLPSRIARLVPSCSNAGCTKSKLQLAASQQRGLHVADRWFCGSDCFESGAKEQITELLASKGKNSTLRSPRMPLGLLLFSREILTSAQLKQVLDVQRETGESVAAIVQQLGFATEDQVTAGIAAQWGCPTFNLETQTSPANIQLPRRLTESYRALPLHFVERERKLLVGFVDAIHHQLLYTIENVTSFTVNACIIKASAFHNALHSTTRTFRQNEVLFERKNSIAEMAHISRNYVLQSGADRARFGLCQDYLWTRIIAPKQNVDILFRLPEN